MIEWILGIIAFVIVITVIIGIHEGGHFFFAKKSGILCYEYAIGMGPIIKKWKKGETIWSVRAIPLGGYVSMAGEEVEENPLKDCKEVKLLIEDGFVTKIITDLNKEEYLDLPTYTIVSSDLMGSSECREDELYIEVEDNPLESLHRETKKFVVKRDCMIVYLKNEELQIAPYDRTFVHKKIGQRFMTVFAGPMMNFILAWIIFILIGIIGGYASNKNVIGETSKGPASSAGLTEKDKIVSIGEYDNINDWDGISDALSNYALGTVESFNGEVVVKYIRDNNEYTTNVTPNVILYASEILINGTDNKCTVAVYGDEENFKKTKAYKAGLRDGDVITLIEEIKSGKKHNINNVNDILKFFNEYDRPNIKNEDIIIYAMRGSEEVSAKVETYSHDLLEGQNIEITKVAFGINPISEFNFVKLLYEPFVETGSACLLVFRTLKSLIFDNTVGISDLSGPIGILSIIKSSAEQGVLSVMNWAAIISVNIGFMNLLPIPALDGGRLAFIIFEAITKKKPSPKVENIIHTVGFVLLMGLFVVVAFNDIVRLIQSIF